LIDVLRSCLIGLYYNLFIPFWVNTLQLAAYKMGLEISVIAERNTPSACCWDSEGLGNLFIGC